MKKLLFLSIIALFSLASANVFGQAGSSPQAGSTHTYWVNSNGTTQASGVGNTYTWEVLRAGLKAAAGTDYQFVGASNGLNQFSVKIKWLSPSVLDGAPYFLVLTETNATCSNKKVVQIDPKNEFAVVIQNVDAALADLGASMKWCAPDIALNLANAAISYNYGTTTLYYRVDAQGLASDWSFNYSFTQLGKDANSTVTATWGADVATATTSLDYSAGGAVNVIGGAQDIIIKVVIVNGTVAEGVTADHNIKLTLAGFSDGANAPVSINGATVNTANIDQTVKARPGTSVISSN